MSIHLLPAAKNAAPPVEVPGLAYYSAASSQALPARPPTPAANAGLEALALMYGYYGAQE